MKRQENHSIGSTHGVLESPAQFTLAVVVLIDIPANRETETEERRRCSCGGNPNTEPITHKQINSPNDTTEWPNMVLRAADHVMMYVRTMTEAGLYW